jgi:hypothetical protein
MYKLKELPYPLPLEMYCTLYGRVESVSINKLVFFEEENHVNYNHSYSGRDALQVCLSTGKVVLGKDFFLTKESAQKYFDELPTALEILKKRDIENAKSLLEDNGFKIIKKNKSD